MKSEDLLKAIGAIDDDLIAEAAVPESASIVSIEDHRKKQKKRWGRGIAGAVAAAAAAMAHSSSKPQPE